MKPQPYLTENGKKIFNQLVEHCRNLMEVDSFELSMLANEYDKYATHVKLAKENGYFNKFNNKTVQVNAYHTICKDSYQTILKHSSKFGLTPADREKIKAFAEQKEKMPDIG